MSRYVIAGIEVHTEGNSDAKLAGFLRKFSAEQYHYECAAAETVFLTMEEAVKEADADRKNQEAVTSADSEDSIHYGIRHQWIHGKDHLIRREVPYTKGFLQADASWRNLYLMDDCSTTKGNPGWEWERKYTGRNGVLNAENEWIELFLTGFYSFMCMHEAMLIHASAVKYRDRAVLFTAPSGTGKTTQAELWRDCLGAEIINGDRIFIRKGQNGKEAAASLYAWGSPWGGSSPYVSNECAGIAAIIVLQQAKENSIQRMDLPEAILHVSSNSFLPVWDQNCLNGMLGVMDLVLDTVPVYRLCCRPDEEAVQMVRAELFRDL